MQYSNKKDEQRHYNDSMWVLKIFLSIYLELKKNGNKWVYSTLAIQLYDAGPSFLNIEKTFQ